MKPWLAVMAATPEGRVAKYQDFDSEAEAAAHVADFLDGYPTAFVAPDPGGGFADWRVDGGALIDDPHVKTAAEIAAEQRAADIARLRTATGDAIVLLVRLIDLLIKPGATLPLSPAALSPAVRAAYQSAKAIADRLDPPP